jgi:hypothetical protein
MENINIVMDSDSDISEFERFSSSDIDDGDDPWFEIENSKKSPHFRQAFPRSFALHNY